IIGVAVQLGLPSVFGDFLPVDVKVSLEPAAIITGILVGGWIALVFALRPLLALRNVSPLQTLRRDADSEVLKMRWTDIPRVLVNVALVGSVVAIAVLRASTVKQGLGMSVATLAVLGILTLSAVFLSFVARKALRTGWPYVVRQGVANLYRPANQTRSVILSLGFGAFLITTLYLVQSNLLRRFEFNAAASEANLVFFDIQNDQAEGVDSMVRARGKILQSAPVVTMRISRINNRAVDQIIAESRAQRTADSIARKKGGAAAESVAARRRAEADARKRGAPPRQSGRNSWALTREYRSTFRDTLTSGEKIVEGKWFSRAALDGKSDTTEMSFEKDVAEELRVK